MTELRRRVIAPTAKPGRVGRSRAEPVADQLTRSAAEREHPGSRSADMDLADAWAFAQEHHQAVFTTLRPNGLPQQSNVFQRPFDDGALRISITATRAKYRNLVARPWASVHLTRPDFFAWVVIEGDVELTPVAAEPHDSTVEELIAYYRAANGEHPDWEDYRRAMVADQRLLIRLRPTRAYGTL